MNTVLELNPTHGPVWQMVVDFWHKKEQELLQDMQNRKHHDTQLPTQKSPIPLNRYEEFGGLENGGGTPQSTLNRSTTSGYKMVARALYNFQVSDLWLLGWAEIFQNNCIGLYSSV